MPCAHLNVDGDIAGKEKEYAGPGNGGTYLRSIYHYDDHGDILQLEQYNDDSSLNKKFAFTYNDKLRVTECKVYNAANVLTYRVIYKYNNNLETGYTIYDLAKKQTNQYDFEYSSFDAHNNWQQKVIDKNHQPFAQTVRKISYY